MQLNLMLTWSQIQNKKLLKALTSVRTVIVILCFPLYFTFLELLQEDSALQTIGQIPDEQKLYNDLMELYEPAVRPVLNANKTVIVNFQLSLNQIVDLVNCELFFV